MFIGKVTGHLVTTQKEPAMSSAKLVVVEAYSSGGGDTPLRGTGRVLVAVDSLGAGIGAYVLVTQGSSARLTQLTKTMPVDAVVIGIVDSLRLQEQVVQLGGV